MEDKYIPTIEQIEDNKFFEIFGNGTRLELLNSSFGINKLTIRLQKFDVNSKKELERIVLYLDIDKALTLANDILSGRLALLAKSAKQGELKKVYAQPGGSVKNNQIFYREFSISKGNKFIVSGFECAGKRTDTGGYVQDTSNKDIPMKKVNVGMEQDTIKAMALMIQNEYQAYRTAQFVMLKPRIQVQNTI